MTKTLPSNWAKFSNAARIISVAFAQFNTSDDLDRSFNNFLPSMMEDPIDSRANLVEIYRRKSLGSLQESKEKFKFSASSLNAIQELLERSVGDREIHEITLQIMQNFHGYYEEEKKVIEALITMKKAQNQEYEKLSWGEKILRNLGFTQYDYDIEDVKRELIGSSLPRHLDKPLQMVGGDESSKKIVKKRGESHLVQFSHHPSKASNLEMIEEKSESEEEKKSEESISLKSAWKLAQPSANKYRK